MVGVDEDVGGGLHQLLEVDVGFSWLSVVDSVVRGALLGVPGL